MTPRGVLIPMTRQATSKELLDVDWDYPVASTFADEAPKDAHTYVSKTRVALAVESAFRLIAKDDPRPLLVLRECIRCKGTEHAVFSRRLDNERTMLLLRWFHCVKLPPEVVQADHPFHNLFAGEGGGMPHLFVSTADGQHRTDYDGKQTQAVFQKQLTALIDLAYEKEPKPALRSVMRCMSQLDMLDLREEELLAQYDRIREERGPDSPKAKRIHGKLEKIRADRKKVMKMAKAVSDLKIRVAKAE